MRFAWPIAITEAVRGWGWLGWAVVGLTACTGARLPGPEEKTAPVSSSTAVSPPPTSAPSAAPPALELVESWPLETTLDHDDIPDAADVWVEMIAGATRTLDLAQFYVSNEPGHRLEPVLSAIEAAAARGVRVRLLVDASFYEKYPEVPDRLNGLAGVERRAFDVKTLMGGVLHAKYFVVDGREAFFGSQNFDWRALEHIQELGLRVRLAPVVDALARTFDRDWRAAGGERPAAPAAVPPTRIEVPSTDPAAEGYTVDLAFSPRGFLATDAEWDLPKLVALIDEAKRSVVVQVLSYRATFYDGAPFTTLDDALRAAGARGVAVRLLVSSWMKEDDKRELEALSQAPGIDVRRLTIPPWSGGDIPFARVVHAKYLVVDGSRGWVGTSNWSGDYFHKSRNVGLVLYGGAIPGRLARFFDDGWSGPYADDVGAPPR